MINKNIALILILYSSFISAGSIKYFIKNNYISTYKRIEHKIKTDSINSEDQNKKTELDYACSQARILLIKRLLKSGAKPDLDQHKIPIIISTYNNPELSNKTKFKIIKLLVNYGTNIDAQDNKGKTLLMYAAENNDKKLVEFLIKLYAEVNIQDNDGKNALMHALYWRQPTEDFVIKKLLKAKTDVNAINKNNENGLILALKVRNVPIALEILNYYDINLNQQDNLNQTALDIAKNKKYKIIEKIIYSKQL